MVPNSYKFSNELVSHLKARRHMETKNHLIGMDRPSRLIDYKGRTLLHYAAKYGELTMTRYFLDSGFPIDHQDHEGYTPLMWAVHRGHGSTSKLLVRQGANIDRARNKHGQTALQMALKCPLEDIAKTFLHQLRRDYPTNEALAAVLHESLDTLHPVVHLRNAEVTRLLLDRGHCPASMDYARGISTLGMAIEQSDYGNVELLLERGMDVNALAPWGLRALDSIPRRDKPRKFEILRLLVDKGADFECSRAGKRRLYEMIFQRGTRQMARLLLRTDRDFAIKNIHALLICLARNRDGTAIEEIRGLEYDANSRDRYGRTLLDFVAEYGQPSAIEFLLSEGRADVDLASKAHGDWTPLSRVIICKHIAASSKMERLKVLLEHGADPQRAFILTYGRRSTTPLEEVVAQNESCLAKPLLAYVALRERIFGQPLLSITRSLIDADQRFGRYFRLCEKHLEIMGKTKIRSFVTLLDLLTNDSERIANRVKNDNFHSQITRLCHELSMNKYYSSKLQRRAREIVKVVIVRRKVADIFDHIFGHLYGQNYLITDKIISFMSFRDLKILLQVEN